MVKKARGLFWRASIRYVFLLGISVILAVLLNGIVIAGNDRVAQAADRIFAGQAVDMGKLLVGLSGLAVWGAVFSFGKSLSAGHYSALVSRRVRKQLGEHLLKLPCACFDERGAGGVLTRFSSDIGEAGRFYSEILPDLLVNLVTVVMVTGYFTRMDGRLILILFASYPVMLVVADKLSKKLARIAKGFRTRMDDRTEAAYDLIQGIEILRSYNLEETADRRIGTVIDDIADHGCKSTRISSMGWLLKGVLTTVPEVVCYLFALYEVLGGRITTGEMLSFAVLLGRVIYPIGDIVFCANDIRTAGVAMERLERLFNRPTEEEERLSACDFGGKTETYDSAEKGRNGDREETAISWSGVKFSYELGNPVLKGASFCIRKGETAAFVGGSGEGKSTIFKILCGLYTKEEGEYLLYGRRIEDWDIQAARDCFSIVSQNVFLFPESIFWNVACGKPGVSRKEAEEACRAARIHDFIAGLPEGYDTLVGERGVKISGGERQRISIARAFLKNAPIILLDEPTSAVDTGTEQEIQEAVSRIAAGKTVIVIAHRLSTVKSADRIYVLQDGHAAESGTHKELLRKKGIYANLYGKEVEENEKQSPCTGI
ncbi:MAG TPA: ABC transporter ATP-binding protein [Candidatus Caccovicinus merdipullorum]|uniref:ABC transporter ATP-binding protein n=1 Tax=Candidatus Caccovicinus merdipullorum TaxID=2840724 RepID=A0A9D1GIR8_9FIRM|nr:ABC transporter ATP-binding protein [Candidatus Caccovicinus merdipullorum]